MASQTGAGAEPDRHRYRAGDGVWYSDRAHYRPVLWLADDLHGDRPRRVSHPACLVKLLPTLPSEHSGSLKSLPVLFRRPALVSVYILTVVVVTAHYTAYSYIEPFVQTVAGLSGNFATVLLLILGGAGIIGSILFGKLGNQHASGLISRRLPCCSPACCCCRPRITRST